MKGLFFDNLHSYNDFSLILTSKEIGSPEVKTEYVDVLGADGLLDLTEAFGDVKFKNRTLSFTFSTIESGIDWTVAYTNVLNKLHGLIKKITLDDDPKYYYLGRVKVSPYKSNKRVGTIVIEVDCEPYKYKQNKTIISNVVENSLTLVFYNGRRKVIPKFTTSAKVEIIHNGNTYNIEGPGTFTLSNIIFVEGMNTLTFNGSATVTVEYQEGDL